MKKVVYNVYIRIKIKRHKNELNHNTHILRINYSKQAKKNEKKKTEGKNKKNATKVCFMSTV